MARRPLGQGDPAFNRSLCERTGAVPLEFDGRHDSQMQPLDQRGRRHMEYLPDHGACADVPIQQVLDAWHAVYPHLRDARPPADEDGAERFERDAIAPRSERSPRGDGAADADERIGTPDRAVAGWSPACSACAGPPSVRDSDPCR